MPGRKNILFFQGKTVKGKGEISEVEITNRGIHSTYSSSCTFFKLPSASFVLLNGIRSLWLTRKACADLAHIKRWKLPKTALGLILRENSLGLLLLNYTT